MDPVHDAAIEIITGLLLDRCVTRQAILDAGVDAQVIGPLVKRKVLTAVFSGVYVFGVPMLTHREFLRASVLYAGPDACPSHRSGLELRGLIWVRRGHATVTTTRRNVTKKVKTKVPLVDGGHGLLRVRETTPTLGLPTETVDGFETTLLPRTLVDAAGQDGKRVLKSAWSKAELKALLDVPAIEREMREHPRAGVRLVRERLRVARPVTRPGDDIRSRSGELAFLKLIDELGLPRPEINVPLEIGGEQYVADFYDRDLGLVFETDGGQHDTPEHKRSDRQRDAAFFIAGLDVVRIGNDEMGDDPAGTRATVLGAYERQRRRAA